MERGRLEEIIEGRATGEENVAVEAAPFEFLQLTKNYTCGNLQTTRTTERRGSLGNAPSNVGEAAFPMEEKLQSLEFLRISRPRTMGKARWRISWRISESVAVAPEGAGRTAICAVFQVFRDLRHDGSMFVDCFQVHVDRFLEPSLRKELLKGDLPYKCPESEANVCLMIDARGELE